MARVGWVPLLAVAALLGAAMIAAVFSNPTIERIPETRRGLSTVGRTSRRPAPRPLPGAPKAQPATARLAHRSGQGSLRGRRVIVVGSLLWVMLRDVDRRRGDGREQGRLRPSRGPRHGCGPPWRRGSLTSRAEQDPRRAVIACWLRLEEAAAAAGRRGRRATPRPTWSGACCPTPDKRRRAGHSCRPLPRGAVRTPRVDAAMREQAHAALRQVRDELLVGAR